MHRVIAVVAFVSVFAVCFSACGGDDQVGSPSTPTATVTTTSDAEVIRPPEPDFVVIVVKNTISGGGRKEVALGKTVRLQIVGDTKDEVHVHGYDKTANVAPGRPANLTFNADVPGIFAVELESRGLKLMDLVVR